jgi:hypothetical protein
MCIIDTVLLDPLFADFTHVIDLSVVIRARRVGWAEYEAMEKFENGYVIFVGNSEMKRSHGIEKRRWESYIDKK